MKHRAAAPADFSFTAKVFHWVTAAVLLVQFPIGFVMVQLGSGSLAALLTSLHQSIGFAILWLALFRLAYRLRSIINRRTSSLANWHSRATLIAHWTIDALLILVPLTGWAGSAAGEMRELFSGASLPAILPPNQAWSLWLLWSHGLLAFSLMVIVAVHLGFGLQGYLEGAAERPESQSPSAAVVSL